MSNSQINEGEYNVKYSPVKCNAEEVKLQSSLALYISVEAVEPILD